MTKAITERGTRARAASLLLSEGSCPGDAGETAVLVLAVQEFVANGRGRHHVGAAGVLHRRGGRAAVAVRVGVAGGVPAAARPRGHGLLGFLADGAGAL
jgi:hypothetical protein